VRNGPTIESILLGIFATVAITFLTFYPKKDGIFWAAFIFFGVIMFALYGGAAFGIMLLMLVIRGLYSKWYGGN